MPPTNTYLDAAQTANFGRPDPDRLARLDGAALRAYRIYLRRRACRL